MVSLPSGRYLMVKLDSSGSGTQITPVNVIPTCKNNDSNTVTTLQIHVEDPEFVLANEINVLLRKSAGIQASVIELCVDGNCRNIKPCVIYANRGSHAGYNKVEPIVSYMNVAFQMDCADPKVPANRSLKHLVDFTNVDNTNSKINTNSNVNNGEMKSSDSSSIKSSLLTNSKPIKCLSPISYVCNVCHEHFSMRHAAANHYLIHESERSYLCEVCCKSFVKKHDFINHCTNHAKESMEFEMINKNIESLLNNSHFDTYDVYANLKKYLDQINVKPSVNNVNNKSTFLLNGDGESSSNSSSLDIMTRTHMVLNHRMDHEKNNLLPEINNNCSKKKLFKYSGMFQAGKKPHACSICNKRFAKKYQLTEHEVVHTGEKPYICDICDKAYTTAQVLKRHKAIHTSPNSVSERKYVCHFCCRSFADKQNLKSHINVHTGEKPFVCEVCNKAFSHKKTLEMHRLVHTGEKPYVCEVCEMGFVSALQRNVHYLSHKEKNPK